MDIKGFLILPFLWDIIQSITIKIKEAGVCVYVCVCVGGGYFVNGG